MNHFVNGYLAVMQVGLGAGAANDATLRHGALDDSISRLGHKLVRTAYRAAGAASRLAARRRAWRRERRAVRELQVLDDHMLRDIGITRGDIRRVVRDIDRGATLARVQGVAAVAALRRAAANNDGRAGPWQRGAA